MIINMLCAEGANFLKSCPVKVKISSGKGFKKFGPQDFGGGGDVPPVPPLLGTPWCGGGGGGWLQKNLGGAPPPPPPPAEA